MKINRKYFLFLILILNPVNATKTKTKCLTQQREKFLVDSIHLEPGKLQNSNSFQKKKKKKKKNKVKQIFLTQRMSILCWILRLIEVGDLFSY